MEMPNGQKRIENLLAALSPIPLSIEANPFVTDPLLAQKDRAGGMLGELIRYVAGTQVMPEDARSLLAKDGYAGVRPDRGPASSGPFQDGEYGGHAISRGAWNVMHRIGRMKVGVNPVVASDSVVAAHVRL